MKRLAISFLMLVSLIGGVAAMGSSARFPPHSGTVTQYGLDFTDDTALAAFLANPANHCGSTGMTWLVPVDFTAMGPSIRSAGCQVQGTLPSYSFQWAQGDSGGSLALIEAKVDILLAAGATMIWVNEPNPAPGHYIQANKAAYNSLHPGVDVIYGWSTGYSDSFNVHLLMLQAGMLEDFAQAEVFNANIAGSDVFVNPFIANGQTKQFPNVKTAISVYSSYFPLCANGGYSYIEDGGFDIITYWNVNLGAPYTHPFLDAGYLTNAGTMTQGKTKPFCNQLFSRVQGNQWTNAYQTTAGFNFNITDGWLTYNGAAAPSTAANCQYQVKSGLGAGNGPNDPSLVTTQAWTSRTCNAALPITVGPGKMCADPGTYTCQVWTSATDAVGNPGNTTYQIYSTAFSESAIWSNYPQSPSYFPLALWWQDLNTTISGYSSFLAAAQGTGINTLINLNGALGGMWSPSAFGVDSSGFLAQIAAAGLYLIPQVNSTTYGCGGQSNTGVLSPNNTDVCSVASYQALGTNTGLSSTIIGYQVADEPQTVSCTQYPMSGIPGQLAIYKGYDSTRPFFMNSTDYIFSAGSCSPPTLNTDYMAAVSVGSFDAYPVISPWFAVNVAGTGTPVDAVWMQGWTVAQMTAQRAANAPFWAYVDSGSDALGFSSQNGYTCNSGTNQCTKSGQPTIYMRAPPALVNAEVWIFARIQQHRFRIALEKAEVLELWRHKQTLHI
jgi:hypothetical protein